MDKKKKIFLIMGLYMLTVAAYGAFIAIASKLLRDNGLDSNYTRVILIASTVYVYYRLWKLLCRRLDRIGGK